MKLSFNVSPNLRQKQSTNQIMMELMIGLFVVFAGQLVYYFMNPNLGADYAIRAIVLLVIATATAFATEFVWCLATKQKFKTFIRSSFPLVTSTILVLMLPVNIDIYALIIGTVFALLIGKLIFGGFGQNIFNPAALGRAIILVSFTLAVVKMDAFSSATTTTVMASEFNWMIANSAAVSAFFEKTSLLALWTGQYVGGIGETNTLLILIVGLFLAIRNVIDWRTPLMYIATVFALTLGVALFKGLPAHYGIGVLWYPLAHLATGGLMFGAIFMMTDPVTSPTSAQGRIIFGIGAGIITVLIRLLGNYPEGVLFAILMMNMLTPMIERLFDGKQQVNVKKAYISTAVLAVVGFATVLGGVAPLSLVSYANSNDNDGDSDNGGETSTATILETTDNGNSTTTFKVEAEGFHGMNVFSITIDNNAIITEFKVLSQDETPGIGDVIAESSFTSKFIGKAVTSNFSEDVVSGATYSSNSALAAFKAVAGTLDGNPTTNGLTFKSVENVPGSYLNAVDNGDGTTTYFVAGEGFYSDLNEFEITVNNDTDEIVGMKNTKNQDTPGIGTEIAEASYMDQFVGKVINADFEVDALTGATLSSKSAVRAVYEVQLALEGK